MIGTTKVLTEYEKCRSQTDFELREFVGLYEHYCQLDQQTLLALIGAETHYLARCGKVAEIGTLEERFPELPGRLIRNEIADSLAEFLDGYCPLSDQLGSLPVEDNQFRFLAEIGRGGEGVVYEAIELPIRRRVAVKVAFPMTQTLEMEAMLLAQLHHRNIPTLYSFGNMYDLPYFVFQLVRGTSLQQLCYHGPGLSVAKSIEWIRQIGSAVEACHAQGIAHCDLNLSNILVAHGRPYLTDFGQARYSTPAPSQLLGTPGRTPPEFLDPTATIHPILGDVFGLGIILYELLTKSVPRSGCGDDSVAPVRPSQLRPEVSPAIDDFCLTAMAHRPEERFPSVKQFNTALAQIVERSQSRRSLSSSDAFPGRA